MSSSKSPPRSPITFAILVSAISIILLLCLQGNLQQVRLKPTIAAATQSHHLLSVEIGADLISRLLSRNLTSGLILKYDRPPLASDTTLRSFVTLRHGAHWARRETFCAASPPACVALLRSVREGGELDLRHSFLFLDAQRDRPASRALLEIWAPALPRLGALAGAGVEDEGSRLLPEVGFKGLAHDYFALRGVRVEGLDEGRWMTGEGSLVLIRGTQSIPNLVHFIWLPVRETPKPPPPHVARNILSWKEHNQEMEVVVWTPELVEEELPEDMAELLLRRVKVGSWKANLLRYLALEAFGGTYLDTDITGFRSIRRVVEFAEDHFGGLFSVCEQRSGLNATVTGVEDSAELFYKNITKCDMVCNAVISARKGHPAMVEMAKRAVDDSWKHLERRPDAAYNVALTGPWAWTKLVRRYHVGVLESFTFYPCLWTERQNCVREKFERTPSVFGMHTWEKSW